MILISTTDLMPPDWRFLAPHCADPGLAWQVHSGLPCNAVERRVRRPAIARYRAALAAGFAARAAAPDALLVSHLPLMGAATNLVRRRLCPDVPQIAFSFNFTDLPTGPRQRLLARALRGIDEFVVFSAFEKRLYAGHFGIPEDRIRFLPWAMEPPRPGPDNPAGQGDYLCAVGGEGRDYALLAEAMRRLPDRRMVIVARPHSVAGIAFPANVTVFTNLPLPRTWAIAAGSCGMVVPLRSAETACGHITLIGTRQLGVPLVITASRGVADYVDAASARLVPPGDAAALTDAVRALQDDPAGSRRLADVAMARTRAENGLDTWVAYVRDAAARLGPTRDRPGVAP